MEYSCLIMKNLLIFYLIITSLITIGVQSADDLEDFPLDDSEPFSSSDDISSISIGSNNNNNNNNNNNADSSNQFDKGSNNLDQSSSKAAEDNKRDIMKRVVAAAMLKPGAKQRLAQVMPILRTMSGPQRLALAALVSAQVMASPESPSLSASLDPSKNMTSELMLPISMDIATMFRGLGREDMARSADYRSHHDANSRGRPQFNNPNSFGPHRDSQQVPTEILSPPPLPSSKSTSGRPQKSRHPHTHPSTQQAGRRHNTVEPTVQECQFFTQSLCLEDANYPQSEILASIKKSSNRDAYSSLLLDSKQDLKDIDPYGDHIERRQGDTNAGDGKMCATRVEMARPKRARATSGAWKYIVNTGDYTQTLRLEMCMRPQTSCSYLADGVRSECSQVYNYHRLLTWDQQTGLTMDVFKVPTCCSCHVQGFAPGRQQNIPAFLETGPETNFISPDIVLATTQRLPLKPGVRLRVDGSHSIPKRESNMGASMSGSRRPQPIVIHRGPPLPIQHDQELPPRYPPYHNNLRRTSYRNHSTLQPSPVDSSSSSTNFNSNNVNRYDNRPSPKPLGDIPIGPHLITPNQRHPELPVDNLIRSGIAAITEPPQPPSPSITPPPPSTTPSRRINYSYHPIIDFFKTATSSSDQRMDKADWTPITEGPRHASSE